MSLLERTKELEQLHHSFQQVMRGTGHCVFISGEAGMGKTALVRQFLAGLESPHILLKGYCDSLFAARPLGPLFDISSQLGEDYVKILKENPGRDQIFLAALEAIENQTKPVILFFEDIHWADAATLDFIRFLARRITQLQCLFILTLRENELPDGHPFRLILGELPRTDFQKFILTPLSRSTVDLLAIQAGRDGEEIFHLTAGIPYYVREVLASYHRGIPETVRDSILSLYHRQSNNTRDFWEKFSVIPGRLELALLSKINSSSTQVVEFCYRAGVLVYDESFVSFKHDLFRTTIEESLSPFRRQEVHKIVMDVMLETDIADFASARIIHHARFAGEVKKIQELAPKAAAEASRLGSHLEAAKFYKLALEHSEGLSEDLITELNEKYSYECYLTNQIPEAIYASEQAIKHCPDENFLKKGNEYRFLSRLHWFAGAIDQSEQFALKAIEYCERIPESREMALAYSNMSQLMMLKDKWGDCIHWGNKAIDLANTLGDVESLGQSYNNIGTAYLRNGSRLEEGENLLKESLRIAMESGFHEDAARAYSNLGHAYLMLKNYAKAKSLLNEGISFCEERELKSWMSYMQSWLNYLFLETGDWDKAESLSRQQLQNPNQLTIVKTILSVVLSTILMRRGEEEYKTFMKMAVDDASKTGDLLRTVPVLKGLLENAWLSGITPENMQLVELCSEKLKRVDNKIIKAEIGFWLWKSNSNEQTDNVPSKQSIHSKSKATALEYLEILKKENPYMQALWLAEGNDKDQRSALLQFREMGAHRTTARIEADMRMKGIDHIPRGPRASTTNNPAGLTMRQMDVLELLSAGMNNKEIASQLFLSDKTVDHHISAILAKLDVTSRVKAVAKAREMGVLKS